MQRHAFKAPARPLEPPTPRTSVLGLDKLAREKREAQADQDGSRKRPRTDDGFKGARSAVCNDFNILNYTSARIAGLSHEQCPATRPGDALARWWLERDRPPKAGRASQAACPAEGCVLHDSYKFAHH